MPQNHYTHRVPPQPIKQPQMSLKTHKPLNYVGQHSSTETQLMEIIYNGPLRSRRRRGGKEGQGGGEAARGRKQKREIIEGSGDEGGAGGRGEVGWGRRKENIHFKSSLKNRWRLISPRLTGETRRGGLRHVTTDFTQ